MPRSEVGDSLVSRTVPTADAVASSPLAELVTKALLEEGKPRPPALPAVAPGLKQFPPPRDYSSLSVRDLLDARDAYSLHLSHLESVVATAIGRYRIRKGDWYEKNPPSCPRPAGQPRVGGERTLYNSVVTPWSWPCVLVFVNRWLETKAFGESPDQMVPRALFLPDGRVVPTCVVKAGLRPTPAVPNQLFTLGKGFLGGGTLVFSEVQNRLHLGSMGCLVTDGRYVYGLTNRHVTGEGGREIHTIVGGERMRIGISEAAQVGKKPFATTYPGWPGTHVLSNVDAGLIRLDDLSYWTTQVYRLGQLDRPIDLNTDTITLDLIDCPVRAFGGASGELAGKIYGLFYRYKSLGGVDYVADLLIGGREPANRTETLPGDSGTLWCLEQYPVCIDGGGIALEERAVGPAAADGAAPPRMRPIALQWGGHVILDESGEKALAHSYALATCLSTALRELDVDLVRDWNTGLPEYWGAVAHYTLAAKACHLCADARLRLLMTNNVRIVSYTDAEIRPKNLAGLTKKSFVPLADVPDMVWKVDPKRRNRERPAHFADMDAQLPSGPNQGRCLLDLCRENPALRTDARAWIKHYEAIDVSPSQRGLLPFRVWQLYDSMVAELRDRKVARFLCAAGTLAHYIGDACQPLHLSYMHDGDPDDTVEAVKNGKPKQVPRASGIHAAYETKMLNRRAAEIIASLNERLAGVTVAAEVSSGREACAATVNQMIETSDGLPPRELIATYLSAGERLWEVHGDATLNVLEAGTRLLAMLWESAWQEGDGSALPDAALVEADRQEIVKLYTQLDFLPSKYLHETADLLAQT